MSRIVNLRILLSLISISLSFSNSVFAQSTCHDTSDNRPKIGLVLSGGGAKGLAHVGVLKAIEKAGLHIDYIAGTSMGSIVAAMYASGYNAEQIERFAHEIQWMDLISSRPNYVDISIEEKGEFDNYLASFPMKGFVPQLNTGFFEPYQVMLKLKEIFFPVYNIDDFNQLNIPFRCIAADVSSGDAIILDKGDLAFATRSSMAIPGVFSATEYNGTKLIDGGVIRNFPVRDVIEMGADYVIGVNLFSGLTPSDKMNSMIDIMMQTINFRDAKDLEEEKSMCDMIIEPDVSAYSAGSFDASETILAIGDQTGEEFYPLFKQLADSLHNAYGLPYASTNRLKAYDSQVRIVDFDFEGLEHTSQSLLLHNLNLRLGHLYTPYDFTKAIKDAMSTGYYKNMTYDLILVEGNSVRFHCKVYENPQNTLKIALSYNTFTNASIFLDYQTRNLIGKNSTTDFKVAISKDFRFRIKNRLFFGQKHNYFFDTQYENTLFYIPGYGNSQGKENVNKYLHNDFRLSFGHSISISKCVSARVGFENFRISPDVADLGDLKGSIRSPYVGINRHVNTLDRKYLPQNGMKLDLDLYGAFFPHYSFKHCAEADSLKKSGKFNDKIVTRFTAKFESYKMLTSRLGVGQMIGLATAYGDHVFVHRTAVGGCEEHMPSHMPFYGIVTAHRYESTLAMLRLMMQYRLVGDIYGLIHLNSAMTFKSIDAYVQDNEPFKVAKYLHGGGVSVAYNLFGVLPMYFTLMYSPEDKFNISVNVGHFF